MDSLIDNVRLSIWIVREMNDRCIIFHHLKFFLFDRLIVIRMHLDVFAFYFLQSFSLIFLIFPIFVKLREATSNVVHKYLWQFFVVFNDEAEKFAEIIVDYVAELFLKRKRLQFFPFGS